MYVTWDYGPERTSITYIRTSNGSCAFATGEGVGVPPLALGHEAQRLEGARLAGLAAELVP